MSFQMLIGINTVPDKHLRHRQMQPGESFFVRLRNKAVQPERFLLKRNFKEVNIFVILHLKS
jgi:hypothetical protein